MMRAPPAVQCLLDVAAMNGSEAQAAAGAAAEAGVGGLDAGASGSGSGGSSTSVSTAGSHASATASGSASGFGSDPGMQRALARAGVTADQLVRLQTGPTGQMARQLAQVTNYEFCITQT
jgi:hypothetical protein